MGFKRTSEGRVYFQRGKKPVNSLAESRKTPSFLEEAEGEDENSALFSVDKPANSTKRDRPFFAGSQPSKSVIDSPPQPGMQKEILELLKSLNDRLQSTQAERNQMRKQLGAYRELIEDLDRKSNRHEQAYLDLGHKLSAKEDSTGSRAARAEEMARETLKELEETRKLVLALEDKTDVAAKAATSIKRQQKQNKETLKKNTEEYDVLRQRLEDSERRQTEIDNKVEETVSQQARLMRKIDKTIEDRARFMRKIERIEDAVLQTRDALNAKAMVLLTDQGVVGQASPDEMGIDYADSEDLPDALLAQKVLYQAEKEARQKSETENKWFDWRRFFSLRLWPFFLAPVLIALVVWAVSNEDGVSSVFSDTRDTYHIADSAKYGDYAGDYTQRQASVELSDTYVTNVTDTNIKDQSHSEERLESEATPDSNQAEEPQNATSFDPKQDDIGAIDLNDDAEIERLLDNNPDAVAAALNAIEPGSASLDTPKEVPTTHDNTVSSSVGLTDADRNIENISNKTPVTPSNPDLPDIIQKVEAEALKGSPEAQHDLAAIYTAGHGNVKQDYERAVYWFTQAAAQGIPNASYNLGVLHHQGLGVKPDIKKAISWYIRAADQGHPEAQYNLGIAYIEGIGVTYDPKKAANYFQNAAEAGVREAAYNLGLIYENGLLGDPKPDDALIWYKTAADQGSPDAQAALSELARALDIDLEDVNRLADSMKPTPLSRVSTVVDNASAPVKSVSTNRTASYPVQPPQVVPSGSSSTVNVSSVRQDVSGSVVNIQNQNLIAQIQQQLMSAGLFPGPADGYSDSLTGDAIRSYQSLNGLQVTGIASPDLLQHMRGSGGNRSRVQ